MKNSWWNNFFHVIIVILTIINIAIIGFSIAICIGAYKYHLMGGSDFSYFYASSAIVKTNPGNLYNLESQAINQQKLLGLNTNGGFLPFLYPPFVALFISILTRLPLTTANYFWSFIQLGILIWLIFLLNQIFFDWNIQERIVLSLTILAFWPLSITFLLGQFSLIILFCLSQLYLAMKNGKTYKAGIWLMLFMLKPQTILFPGVMTINKRYWRIAVTAVIVFLVLAAFSCIFLGVKPWIDYARLIPNMNNYFGEFGFNQKGEYTINGMLSLILGYSSANIIRTVSSIALLLGLVLIFRLWLPAINSNSSKYTLLFALMVTLSVFLSLHLYPHDSLLLVLPAALFYDFLRQNNYRRKVYSLLILASPSVFVISAFTSFNLFGFIRPPILVIIMLLIWIVYYLLKYPKLEDNELETLAFPTS